MTKKEIIEALGIEKKEVIKDLIITILVLLFIFGILFIIRSRYANCVEVKEPVFLEKNAVCLIEDGTAYIPLTYLDNLEGARYVKEIKLTINEKEYVGAYEEGDLNTNQVPKTYKGSRKFYTYELIKKPYAIRKQTIKVKGINEDMKVSDISITFIGDIEIPLDFNITFTSDIDSRSITPDEKILNEMELLEGISELIKFSEWSRSDSGEVKLNVKGISSYLESTY